MRYLLPLYLALFAAAMLRVAAVRPVWFDEVFTAHLSRPANLTGLPGHLAAGVDLNPPLSYLLTAVSLTAFGDSEWALRLPAVAGGVLAAACLYAVGRFRGGPAGGAVVMAAGLLNQHMWEYFYEARPYGLAVGFAAAAFLCWQRAAATDGPRRRWLAGLAAAAALGSLTHYYFLAAAVGLGCGELVRWAVRRRVDWSVAGCLAVAGVITASLSPVWRGPSREYAAGFWTAPRLDAFDAWELYEGLTGPGPRAWLLAAAVVAVAGRFLHRPPAASPPRTPVWELAALFAWTAGPLTAMVLGATVTGVYWPRYTVPLLLGPGVLIGLGLSRLAGPGRWAAFAAAVVLAVAGPAGQWQERPAEMARERERVNALVADLAATAGGQQVVMESPRTFAEVWYYGTAAGVRPVFVVDLERSQKYRRMNTVEVGLTRLNRVVPVPLARLGEVEAAADAGGPVYFLPAGNTWLTPALAADGFRVSPLPGGRPGELVTLSRGR